MYYRCAFMDGWNLTIVCSVLVSRFIQFLVMQRPHFHEIGEESPPPPLSSDSAEGLIESNMQPAAVFQESITKEDDLACFDNALGIPVSCCSVSKGFYDCVLSLTEDRNVTPEQQNERK